MTENRNTNLFGPLCTWMAFLAVTVSAVTPREHRRSLKAPLNFPAQSASEASTPGAGDAPGYSFRFENTRFYIPIIAIDLDAYGSGGIKFKRGESDDLIEIAVKLQPATLARIGWLIDSAKFFESDVDYQSKKDFSHLGWMTIAARRGGRSRTARFNWTTNAAIGELSELFRGISTQEIDLFDIELARQHQPLDLPRQLETLENDLKLERIAEPSRLLTPLVEIVNDDTAPLIARNLAKRLVKNIEKGQYKTPMKAAK